MPSPPETVRLAAVADLHCTKTAPGALAALFEEVGGKADVLLLGGDLTDYGLPEEAHQLARELSGVKIPILAVLGNHDCESGKEAEVTRILAEAGVRVLDGDGVEILGVGFAGVKGFAGGFGRRTLEPWGEPVVKAFVFSVKERARGAEIFPFLGSSRLEEPLNRYRVSVAFHGHAHRGAPEGRTSGGVPVFNVALPVMRRVASETFPVKIFEVSAPVPVSVGVEAPSRRHDDPT